MTDKHQPSHLDIEQPLFHDPARPHIWIQWKGTDVCCDIHCACGAHLHFDGDFLYFFRCPHCGQHWEVGTHMPIYPVSKERAGDDCKEPPPDEGYESAASVDAGATKGEGSQSESVQDSSSYTIRLHAASHQKD